MSFERMLKAVSEHLGFHSPEAAGFKGQVLSYVPMRNLIDEAGIPTDILDHIELVMVIEDEFGIEMPDDFAEKLFDKNLSDAYLELLQAYDKRIGFSEEMVAYMEHLSGPARGASTAVLMEPINPWNVLTPADEPKPAVAAVVKHRKTITLTTAELEFYESLGGNDLLRFLLKPENGKLLNALAAYYQAQ